jgi:restriction system protein
MPTYKCLKHSEIMIEKMENEKIVPYCLSCLVEKEFNNQYQQYLENKDHNEREFKKSNRKYKHKKISSDSLNCMWVCLFNINLFTALQFWEMSILISIGITLIYVFIRSLQGEYTFKYNQYSEPTIENTRKRIEFEISGDSYGVERFKKKLKNEYYAKSVEMDKIDTMGGFEFEEYIGQLLSNLGYQNVNITPKSGDGGVDITAKDQDGYKVAVQCKRLKSKVGNSAIQEVYLGKRLENCKRAIVITNSYFTKPAIEAAAKTKVELWDRDKLIEQMRKVEIKITWEYFLRQHYNVPKQEPMNYKNFAL